MADSVRRYKVTRQVLAACCQTLRSQVLNKVAANDLNNFKVQLFRLNSQSWDDINDVSLPLQNFVQARFSFFYWVPFVLVTALRRTPAGTPTGWSWSGGATSSGSSAPPTRTWPGSRSSTKSRPRSERWVY